MRLGEALALQWQDLNFSEREIRVARALGAGGRIDTPKSGRGRTVDMSQELARTLRRLELERKTETLKRGWSALPSWVFCDSTGRPLSPRTVEDAFKRVLKAAGLPPHFSPHSLRHSFASLLLQQGESPVYVQRQLGHASSTLTVDLYGRLGARVGRAVDGRRPPHALNPRACDEVVQRAPVLTERRHHVAEPERRARHEVRDVP